MTVGAQKLCKCGCGEPIAARRVFVNKVHQLQWMAAGGARELNAMLPDEVRVRGGQTVGRRLHASGQLKRSAEKGGARSREIAAELQRTRTSPDGGTLR